MIRRRLARPNALGTLGSPKNFFIHDGYQPRFRPAPFDDTPFTDEFQREVYARARQVLEQERLHGVCDVGCGSGYKLMHFFEDECTLGLDLEPTVSFLRNKYPQRAWRTVDLARDTIPGYGLVICADVIEHLEDPGELLRFLERTGARRILLSTPERELLDHGTRNGPPRNVHHCREWDWPEFHTLIGSAFRILRHEISDATQMVLCRPVR